MPGGAARRPARNVTIGAGDKGARKVVLTYLSGPWPGIYTFDSGRLKEVDSRAGAGKSPPSPRRKRSSRQGDAKVKSKPATTERVYVQ